MKPTFWAVAFLFFAPVVRAQPATPSAPLAQIDSAALNLLARMNWKYQHLFAYETYLDVTNSEQPDAKAVTRRLRLDRGAFVLSEMTPDNHWRKWIYGGSFDSIAYDSRFPKRYIRRELMDSGPGDMHRVREVLDGWQIWKFMLLPVMEGEWPAQLLIQPDLESVSRAPGYGVEIVTLSFGANFMEPDSVAHAMYGHTTLRFVINPETLLLLRIERIEGREPNTVTTIENYPHARFDPDLNFEIFSSAAPLDYKLIKNFDGPAAKR